MTTTPRIPQSFSTIESQFSSNQGSSRNPSPFIGAIPPTPPSIQTSSARMHNTGSVRSLVNAPPSVAAHAMVTGSPKLTPSTAHGSSPKSETSRVPALNLVPSTTPQQQPQINIHAAPDSHRSLTSSRPLNSSRAQLNASFGGTTTGGLYPSNLLTASGGMASTMTTPRRGETPLDKSRTPMGSSSRLLGGSSSQAGLHAANYTPGRIAAATPVRERSANNHPLPSPRPASGRRPIEGSMPHRQDTPLSARQAYRTVSATNSKQDHLPPLHASSPPLTSLAPPASPRPMAVTPTRLQSAPKGTLGSRANLLSDPQRSTPQPIRSTPGSSQTTTPLARRGGALPPPSPCQARGTPTRAVIKK